jgi:hypothetical protein
MFGDDVLVGGFPFLALGRLLRNELFLLLNCLAPVADHAV